MAPAANRNVQVRGYFVFPQKGMRDFMKRFRVIATAIAAACLMGSAVAAAPVASASTAPYAISAGTARADASGPCLKALPPNGAWYRCTTTSYSGGWVRALCNPGQNYNATNGPFNVYAALNACGYRVWLHQYTDWQNHGWSLCTSPETNGVANYYQVSSGYEHPMNIYISSTQSACP